MKLTHPEWFEKFLANPQMQLGDSQARQVVRYAIALERRIEELERGMSDGEEKSSPREINTGAESSADRQADTIAPIEEANSHSQDAAKSAPEGLTSPLP